MHPKLPDYRELEGMAETAANHLTAVAEVVTTTVKGLTTAGVEAVREIVTTVAPTVMEATRQALATTTTPQAGQSTYLTAATITLPAVTSTIRAAKQCQVT